MMTRDGVQIGDSATLVNRVVTVLHVDDTIKAGYQHHSARVFGVSWQLLFAAAGVTADDLWPRHLPDASRTIWNAGKPCSFQSM